MKVDYSPVAKTVRVGIHKSKIVSHGRPSLGRLTLRLHVYRCTADIGACHEFYEPLTAVEGEYAQWWQVVVSGQGSDTEDPGRVRTDPGGKIVQANTFLNEDGTISLKVYEESARVSFGLSSRGTFDKSGPNHLYAISNTLAVPFSAVQRHLQCRQGEVARLRQRYTPKDFDPESHSQHKLPGRR